MFQPLGVIRALQSVLLTKCNLGDQIKNSGVGWACRTYGREESYIQDSMELPDGKRQLEEPGVEGRIIL